jgi:hypothetical protein
VPLNTIPKDWRKIAKVAREHGWAIFISGKGKLAWFGPKGQKVYTAATPPRRGATNKNYILQLRRNGVPGA